MSKRHSHQLDIYGAWLHLVTDEESYRRLRRRLPSLAEEIPASQGEVSLTLHTATNGKCTPHLAIWLDLGACDDQRDLVDLVAHEATHAAGGLLDHIGQGYDGNSEALAYLVGFISGWLWDNIPDQDP